jgi:hypothetical protein
MRDVRAIAAASGVRVEFANLGNWAHVTLVAEYDPDGPVIRVDERASWRILRQAQDDISEPGDNRSEPSAVTTSPSVTLTLRQAQGKGAPHEVAIEHAIAHELYHHREAVGEIARIADRAARERAADAFADDLVRAR